MKSLILTTDIDIIHARVFFLQIYRFLCRYFIRRKQVFYVCEFHEEQSRFFRIRENTVFRPPNKIIVLLKTHRSNISALNKYFCLFAVFVLQLSIIKTFSM